MNFRQLGLLYALVWCFGCSGPSVEPLDLPEGCNPLLAGVDCLLPYPSNVFLVDDASTPSGKRVELSVVAKPLSSHGVSADVNEWMAADGFSMTPPIVAILGSQVRETELPGIFDDPEKTLNSLSPTLLVEAETGTLIPHFTDLDPRATDSLEQALIVRPIVGLDPETRYIVVMQGLRGEDGLLVSAPEGFRRIRDAGVGRDPVLSPLALRYEREIFPVLQSLGVVRKGIQLAWDFTTASRASITDDILRARELVLEALEATPPTVEILGYEDEDEGQAWRTVSGIITGPSVIESAEPGAALLRDEQGRVRLGGTVSFPFLAQVPRSVAESDEPGRILQFGHGFFGKRTEGIGGSVRSIADATESVTFSIDWWGMSSEDIGLMCAGFSQYLATSLEVTDRVPQAMANWLILTHAIEGPMKELDAFRRPGSGDLLYDDSELNFLGISMGAIFGGVYGALNPSVDRVILHVGGIAFTQMMFRSGPFGSLLFMLDLSMPDPLEQQKLAAVMQTQFDRIDPASFAPYLVGEELPIGPPSGYEDRSLLLQVGLADSSVPNFTSFIHARMTGAELMSPSPYVPWGIDPAEEASNRPILTLFDLGEDPSFAAQPDPPQDGYTSIHNRLRGLPEVVGQMRDFLVEGLVTHPCDYGCGSTSELVIP